MDDEVLCWGPVCCFRGKHKGKIFYYDDDDTSKTAICYVGHPLHFRGYYRLRLSSLREPTIDDLIERKESIRKRLTDMALHKLWDEIDSEDMHELWVERSLISDELFERRYMGEFAEQLGAKAVFLCHSSADKGIVRMLHDELKRRGVFVWLDENEIEVGQSLIQKISDGLSASRFLIICLSKHSISSKWARKEWQSFLARQLASEDVIILPALMDDCIIPSIIADLKYADFRESFNDGFRQVYRAIKRT